MIENAALGGGGKKFLSAYIMPGFPHKDSTLRVLKAAEVAGVDFVELGIPFSDPLADGPVVQRAAQTAIENGMTPRTILDLVAEFRKTSQMPIVLMGYVNSFLNGIGRDFAARIRDAGADGIIMPDLSLEESDETRREIEDAGLSLVLLIAPTSGDKRIGELDKATTDFSYCVSVTGVTGARKDLMSGDVASFLERVRRLTVKPFVVGFGISTPEAAREISAISDGIVVGSALLQRISASQRGEEAASAHTFLSSLRAAIDK
jgi:tryptophan synthase alpha chain